MLKRRKTKVRELESICPLGTCMEVLGGIWTPQIIWYLSEEARRFSELKSDLKTVSSKTLTSRLKRLEEQEIVIRKLVNTSPPTVEYSLSKKGKMLVPIVKKISEVGNLLKKM